MCTPGKPHGGRIAAAAIVVMVIMVASSANAHPQTGGGLATLLGSFGKLHLHLPQTPRQSHSDTSHRPRGASRAGNVARSAFDAGCRGHDLEVATAVGLAESAGRPRARLVTAKEDSRGIWQINTYAHPAWARRNLYDPKVNARAMYTISGGCHHWQAWATHESGLYRARLDEASQAIGGR